jgi:hypothetical protein
VRGQQQVPAGVDASVPSIARVYDAVLGGEDDYEVDRAVRDQLFATGPEAVHLARDDRARLARVVRYLAGTVGIDQFLDCGSGLPTADDTHQVAQRVDPGARVVHVDDDPVVLAHGRALLTDDASTSVVAADIRDPRAVLAAPEVGDLLDLNRPVGLLHVGILHHVDDDEGPHDVLRGYVDALAPGSHVAVSHFHTPADGSPLAERAAAVEQVLLGGELGRGRFRTGAEIQRFFDGLEMVEPGLSALARWWPDGPPPELGLHRLIMLGGLARKG